MIMKKNLTYFLAISSMISLLAVSCSKVEDPQEPVQDTEVSGGTSEGAFAYTLTASIETTAQTKTTIGDADAEGVRQVEWQKDDEVVVLYADGSTTANADAAGTEANFSFDAPAGDLWFVYPSAGTPALEDGKLSLTIPAVQDGTFANHSYLVAKSNTSAESVKFFNACSMFKIVVTDATLTKAIITSNNGEALTGTVSYAWTEDDFVAPEVDVTAADQTSLTVNFNGVGEYLVAALPGLNLKGGVTIKFYRNDKPAGGNATTALLPVARAQIASFGDSDAICNRYVATNGSAANNGRTPAKAWDLAQFINFMQGTAVTGAKLTAMEGVTIHFAAGTYSPSAKIVPQIKIKTTLVGESKENTIFDGASNKIIWDIWKNSKALIEFKNFTFQRGKNTSTEGGAFRIGDDAVSFENCRFINNQATASNKQGGALNIAGSSRVSFKNCSFGDGTSAGRNYASQGGAVNITLTSSVSFEDCVFNYNESTSTSSGGACLYVNGSECVVKMNRCVFKNNKAVSRGTIQLGTGALIYMNAVSFNNNTTTASSSPWGIILHGANSYACMNNVTAFDNKNTNNLTRDCTTINNDAGMLITNSTIVDFGGQYVVRVNDVNGKDKLGNLTMCNNIFVNRSAANSAFWIRGAGNNVILNNYGHNLRSSSSADGNVADSNPASDKFSVTHETLGGSLTDGVYVWNNTLTDFTHATAKDVEAAMKACTKSMAGVNNVGTDFYNWLVGLGEFDKDGRGKSRGTGNWWPGAYQN